MILSSFFFILIVRSLSKLDYDSWSSRKKSEASGTFIVCVYKIWSMFKHLNQNIKVTMAYNEIFCFKCLLKIETV